MWGRSYACPVAAALRIKARTVSGYVALWGYRFFIHHIYINCWLPVYRWSVMDKQVTSTPPIPGNGGVLVACILHCWPPVDWEPAINVDMVNKLLDFFPVNFNEYHGRNITMSFVQFGCCVLCSKCSLELLVRYVGSTWASLCMNLSLFLRGETPVASWPMFLAYV